MGRGAGPDLLRRQNQEQEGRRCRRGEDMAISVKLQAFEGPLDLLLHLIEKDKVDIYDIPIVQITDQYMAYVREMGREDMEVTSEFLVMASTLLDIKAKMLLPRDRKDDEEEEGDPREELVNRLLEYKMYKYLAGELRDKEIEAGHSMVRKPDLPQEVQQYEPPINYEELLGDTTFKKLEETFRQVMRRHKNSIDPVRSTFGKIEREVISVESRTAEVLEQVRREKTLNFRSLLEAQASRTQVVVTFLVILELMKNQEILISQEEIGGEILIQEMTPEKKAALGKAATEQSMQDQQLSSRRKLRQQEREAAKRMLEGGEKPTPKSAWEVAMQAGAQSEAVAEEPAEESSADEPVKAEEELAGDAEKLPEEKEQPAAEKWPEAEKAEARDDTEDKNTGEVSEVLVELESVGRKEEQKQTDESGSVAEKSVPEAVSEEAPEEDVPGPDETVTEKSETESVQESEKELASAPLEEEEAEPDEELTEPETELAEEAEPEEEEQEEESVPEVMAESGPAGTAEEIVSAADDDDEPAEEPEDLSVNWEEIPESYGAIAADPELSRKLRRQSEEEDLFAQALQQVEAEEEQAKSEEEEKKEEIPEPVETADELDEEISEPEKSFGEEEVSENAERTALSGDFVYSVEEERAEMTGEAPEPEPEPAEEALESMPAERAQEPEPEKVQEEEPAAASGMDRESVISADSVREHETEEQSAAGTKVSPGSDLSPVRDTLLRSSELHEQQVQADVLAADEHARQAQQHSEQLHRQEGTVGSENPERRADMREIISASRDLIVESHLRARQSHELAGHPIFGLGEESGGRVPEGAAQPPVRKSGRSDPAGLVRQLRRQREKKRESRRGEGWNRSRSWQHSRRSCSPWATRWRSPSWRRRWRSPRRRSSRRREH